MAPSSTSARTAQLDALMRASRAFSGIVAASLAQVGDQITPQQLRVLVIVATHDRVKAGDVSDAMGIHPSGATRLCDKLVSGGWLDRRTDPENRRQVTLELTPAGSRLLMTVMDHRRRILAGVLDALAPADGGHVQRCLTLISDALDEPAEADWQFHGVSPEFLGDHPERPGTIR